MNENNIVVLDFETGSRNARRTQPLQLASVVIDGRKLEIIQNSIFQSYLKPIDKPEIYGLDSIESEALEVNKISLDTINNAPTLDVIWPKFTKYVDQYNPKKSKWTAPILAGYNNVRFDNLIIERICGGQKRFTECEKEPYKLGPWIEDKQESTLFSLRDTIDLMHWIWYWTENNKDVTSISFDAMRDFFGIVKTGAHNAIADVLATALLIIRFLKLARRHRIDFKNTFEEENKIILETLENYKI